MTSSRRIILNVLASHGRSLFVIACGFLTGRWALMALGAENCGLLGLIGGLTVIMMVVNNTLSIAVSRFFAYAFGEVKNDPSKGMEECHRWFNIAILIHSVISVLLIAIGYPVATYLIKNYLSVPEDRIVDCILVLRWSCASSFIAMISVPFRAMYIAKQNIAELTVYSLLQTTLYTGALFYMVNHPNDWLVWIAFWLFLQNSMANLLMMGRAFYRFPECVVRPLYMLDFNRITRLIKFSFWQFLGVASLTARDQGLNIFVNKWFGPATNATYTLAWSLSGRLQTFANEVDAAFSPAISTAYGSNNTKEALSLVYRCSKFSTIMIAIFLGPFLIELPKILEIWLETPPPSTGIVCGLMAISYCVNKLSSGQYLALIARGQNRSLQVCDSVLYIMTVVVAMIGCFLGMGIASIGGAFLVISVFQTISRVLISKKKAFVPVRDWALKVVLRITIAMLISMGISLGVTYSILPSINRIFVTILIFEIFFLLACWSFVLDITEQQYVANVVKNFFKNNFRVK